MYVNPMHVESDFHKKGMLDYFLHEIMGVNNSSAFLDVHGTLWKCIEYTYGGNTYAFKRIRRTNLSLALLLEFPALFQCIITIKEAII